VERDRRVERAPDLSTLYESEPAARKRRWPWVLFIVLLALNLLILGILFRPQKTQRQSAIQEAPVETSESVGQTPVAPREPAVQSPAATPAESKPATGPAADATPAVAPATEAAAKPPAQRPPLPTADLKEPPPFRAVKGPTRPLSQEARVARARKERPAPKTSFPPDKPPATTSEKALETPAVQPEQQPEPEKVMVVDDAGKPPEAAMERPSDADAVSAAEPSLEETRPDPAKREEPAQEPASGGAIPLAMDLPEDIREKFKDLKINVHAFYENSDKSFVFINMRRYVAGDRVGKRNMTLVAITPDGVILDYGEGQALLLTEN
jgi:hypothetical protein